MKPYKACSFSFRLCYVIDNERCVSLKNMKILLSYIN